MEQEGLWDEAFCDRYGPIWHHTSRPPRAERMFGRAAQLLPVHRCSNHTIPPLTRHQPAEILANCLLFKRAKREPQQQQQQCDKQAPNTPCMLTLLQPLPSPFPPVFADEETSHCCWPNLPSPLQNLPLCPPRAGFGPDKDTECGFGRLVPRMGLG